ncbi:MAG: ABC transporter ATP-binding protein [Bacteroidota bacterium]|nr:ABC transporter ATP-binding protein [Bacteroidota bacterium]
MTRSHPEVAGPGITPSGVLLEVRNLVTEFRTENETVKAVNDISFTIMAGETIGIVGESGSGKSVTALSAMRLIPNPPGEITGGEILYNSRENGQVDLAKVSEPQMRNYRGNEIAMIFQEPMTSLNPVYTCGDQVMEAILQHKKFPEISSLRENFSLALRWLNRLLLVGIILLAGYNLFSSLDHNATENAKVAHNSRSLVFNLIILGYALIALGIYLFRRYKGEARPLKFYTPKERAAKKQTTELFKKVQLPDPERIFDAYPHQISGGQKQRVMIAMAMSCNPQLLIADEPTTALDVTVQKTILEVMKDLQAENNMSIMFITHDLGVIAELADRVVVMYKGKIVEQGTVLEIFSNPQHPYTKSLLACRPPLNRRLHWLPTVADFMHTSEEGEIVENNLSVLEVTGSLSQTVEERKAAHDSLYAREPILRLEGLKTYFTTKKNVFGKVISQVKAVDDVTFDVYPGETLGLVGESGCGKTTLGRTILRLIEPTAGKIIYKGKDITKIPAAELRALRKDIQIIFQDPYSSLNPRVTIGNAIMEPMRVHNILENDTLRKARVIELLRRVNMNESHFYRYPHEFSGGQRQRICIARALALKPQFIICDESVSALDVSVQAQVLNLLNELKKEFHFTYIFISHDLSVVKFMSDRMVVMNEGKIEEMGDADMIYNDAKTEYTQKLINAIPKGELDDIRASMSKKRMRTEAF